MTIANSLQYQWKNKMLRRFQPWSVGPQKVQSTRQQSHRWKRSESLLPLPYAQNLLIFANPRAAVQQSLTFTHQIRKKSSSTLDSHWQHCLGYSLSVITAPMLCLSCKKNHNTTPFPEETGFGRARLLLGFWSKMLRKMSSVQVLEIAREICQNEITCTSESTQALLPISDSSAIFCLQDFKVPHFPCHLSPYLAKAICFGVPRIDCCLLVSLQL